MARRRKTGATTDSDLIREFIAHNPVATPKEIRVGMSEQGNNVSPSLINRIKYNDPLAKSAAGAPARAGSRGRPKRRGRRPGRRPGGRPGANGAGQISIEHLIAAKKLAEQLGGIDSAKQAVDALAKLS